VDGHHGLVFGRASMPISPESLYVQLGRLIESMPDLENPHGLTSDEHKWLGRAYALVNEAGQIMDAMVIIDATQDLESSGLGTVLGHRGVWNNAVGKVINILHRALAIAELRAPVSAQGAFIAAKSPFEAIAAIDKVMSDAVSDVFIVDPYMEANALTEFAVLAPEQVPLRLMADQAHLKPSLSPAAARWTEQFGASRPLSVRLAPARSLHDRLIAVDRAVVWLLSQSLNAFAQRASATIVRAPDETASLKLAAHEDIWTRATPVQG
jgi:hypothetical protein